MRTPGHTSLGSAMQGMQSSGNLVMVAGVIADATLFFNANTTVWPARITVGGTAGFIDTATVTPGSPGTYTLTSTNALDTSTFRALLLNAGVNAPDKGLGPSAIAGGALGAATDGIFVQTTTLVAGSKVLNGHRIPSNMGVMLQMVTPGGAPGHLTWVATAGNPGSLTITSSNGADTSVVRYAIIDVDMLKNQARLGGGEGNTYPAFQYLRAAMVGGTVTIPCRRKVTGNKTGIIVGRKATGGVLGHLSVGTVTAGDPGSIVVNSTDAGDTSTVEIFIWDQQSYGSPA